MAQNDVIFFDDAWERIHEDMNLETDAFKIGLIKSAANGGDDPADTDAGPAWSGGTTNFGTSEVTPGGNYITAGAATANPVLSQTGGAVTWDTDDPATWAKNAANPTNARWGILYDDTTTIKYAIAFIDLGADYDMTTGDLAMAVNALGWFTEDV